MTTEESVLLLVLADAVSILLLQFNQDPEIVSIREELIRAKNAVPPLVVGVVSNAD